MGIVEQKKERKMTKEQLETREYKDKGLRVDRKFKADVSVSFKV